MILSYSAGHFLGNKSVILSYSAGHFLGNDTVIDRLRRRGLEVEHTGPGENITRSVERNDRVMERQRDREREREREKRERNENVNDIDSNDMRRYTLWMGGNNRVRE